MYEEQLSMDTATFKNDYTQLYCSMDYGIKNIFHCVPKNSVLRASFKAFNCMRHMLQFCCLFSMWCTLKYVRRKKRREREKKNMQILLIKCGPQNYFWNSFRGWVRKCPSWLSCYWSLNSPLQNWKNWFCFEGAHRLQCCVSWREFLLNLVLCVLWQSEWVLRSMNKSLAISEISDINMGSVNLFSAQMSFRMLTNMAHWWMGRPMGEQSALLCRMYWYDFSFVSQYCGH